MNYLAHLALAQPDQGLILGGFLGDFIKGPVPTGLRPDIEQGIRLHRAIDAFSDRHASLQFLRKRLPPDWRRYTGVLLDMVTDHYLAANWSARHEQDLTEFTLSCQQLLLAQQHDMPTEARQVLDRLCRYRWLSRYADLEFTMEAVARIGQRMRCDNPLGQSRAVLEHHHDEVMQSASWLYDDSLAYVAEWRSQNL